MSELSDLQYPIGAPTRPQTLSSSERAEAIAVIAGLPGKLDTALDGLSTAQLDTPYRPEGWTIRQLVHHIADSHMNAYARMRQAITGSGPGPGTGPTATWPTIFAYDQAAWAALPDSQLPAAVSLQLIDALHQRWAATLRAVPEQDWPARGFLHPENGPQTLEQALALYDWHSRHHLAHIVNCRVRHGW